MVIFDSNSIIMHSSAASNPHRHDHDSNTEKKKKQLAPQNVENHKHQYQIVPGFENATASCHPSYIVSEPCGQHCSVKQCLSHCDKEKACWFALSKHDGACTLFAQARLFVTDFVGSEVIVVNESRCACVDYIF